MTGALLRQRRDPDALAPVVADGKQFAVSGERFVFRGVTYGTFEPRDDGARFPDHDQMKQDLVDMAAAGFTVIRTYTPPPDDLLQLAAEQGLRVLAGIFYSDWRYLHGSSCKRQRQVLREARDEVRREATRLAGDPRVLAISVGNELPADVIRWVGTDRATSWIDSLAREVKVCDPGRLVTYANYPTAEYLTPRELDFLMFNVFLEHKDSLRRYLTRLQNLAGDRPLVLGEIGLDSGPDAEGEARQAAAVDWQLETAVERGVAGTCVFSWTDQWWVGDAEVIGWHFGLTRADRSPKPALAVAADWNRRSVRDLDFDWPTMSVVICAYNAAATLDECLVHTCALDYPGLEILVVDDGSTDGTAAIAARHDRAVLLSVPHAGLSVARNAGWVAAAGELVVYLDSDAYPSPEWPWYVALAFDDPRVGGAGGPNVPPVGDLLGAAQVAQAPGGPVHVLVTDDRAEHVPGCNMAFWREVLQEVDGFDPVYMAAGDDVDACWKVLDAGWEIGFHPAALVWHHRRAGLRSYLRQQRGYGRSEALVEARHPDRFNSAGSARWRGRIYNPALPAVTRPRIYRGPFGAAPFQSVYQAGGHALDYAHQIGVPAALGILVVASLGALLPVLLVPGVFALVYLVSLTWVDAMRANPPVQGLLASWRFRLGVAVMTMSQPIARTWGRSRARRPAREDLPAPDGAEPVLRRVDGGLEAVTWEDRSAFMSRVIAGLRRKGVHVVVGSGWDGADATLLLSWAVEGALVSSAYPEGTIQLALRTKLRVRRMVVAVGADALLAVLSPWAGAVAVVVVLAALVKGVWQGRAIMGRLAARRPYSGA
jgi:cellulose synthase/poly-beta-1,6-N-acetylglucosamine synthase-like glycosyltransferase/exo-beta-1,3-glucanase (GH17 family)